MSHSINADYFDTNQFQGLHWKHVAQQPLPKPLLSALFYREVLGISSQPFMLVGTYLLG